MSKLTKQEVIKWADEYGSFQILSIEDERHFVAAIEMLKAIPEPETMNNANQVEALAAERDALQATNTELRGALDNIMEEALLIPNGTLNRRNLLKSIAIARGQLAPLLKHKEQTNDT